MATTHIAQLPAFGMAWAGGTVAEPRCLAHAMRSADSSQRSGEDQARNDEELMDEFRLGDADAFEILVTRHSRGLYNFLLRSVHAPARAEELLQEVLLRVIRSKDRYRRSARFTTWVYTIARNLCVDESRRARFRDHESLDAPLRRRRAPGSATLASTLASEELLPELIAESPRLRERLNAAVQRLPGDQREVFLMRLMAGMSFREIGETVGAPENTVKSRMRYALDKLREELADLRPVVCAMAIEEAAHG
jgi:RNA polymerase sigma-70 factor (ECF subfamily)